MQSARSYKILVVEDEGLIALDIAERLTALGHQVLATVSTAQEAVEQAGAADLVLMDVRIDGPRDGIDAAAEIRLLRVPVVFLTAQGDRPTIERAKLAGAYGYLVKPVATAPLLAAIEIAIHRHRTERYLEEREAWLSAALGSVPEAMIVADSEGRVRMLNRAAENLTGWSTTEAQGRPLEEVAQLTEEAAGKTIDDLATRTILRGSPVLIGAGVHLSGRPVEGSAAPLLISPNEASGIVLSLRDATNRRSEERRVRQDLRIDAAARLSSRIAGEYAGLVETIRVRTNDLMRQFGEYSPARQAIDQIRESVEAADRITKRLTGFGSRQTSQFEIVSLNSILRRMLTPIQSAAGPMIAVSLHSQPNCGRIKTDLLQLEQAIMSLALHACAVMPDGGFLKLETAKVDSGTSSSYIALRIEYAAQEPNLDTLFDPQEGEGGLGLSIAHSIASEHGGYVTAQALPDGTRVELLLPGLIEQPSKPPAPSHPPRSILLVDPRDQVRAQLHNFFESAGYNLLEASDREEALALAEFHEGSVDLLIGAKDDVAALVDPMSVSHPILRALAVTEDREASPFEIRRPFTQRSLLDRVESILTGSAVATSS